MRTQIALAITATVFSMPLIAKSVLQEEMEKIAKANDLHHLVSEAQPAPLTKQQQVGARNLLKCAQYLEDKNIDKHTAFLYAAGLNNSSKYTLFASPEEAPEAYALAAQSAQTLGTNPPIAIFFDYDSLRSSHANGMHVVLSYGEMKKAETLESQKALVGHELAHLAAEHNRKRVESIASNALLTKHELAKQSRDHELEADKGAALVAGHEATIALLTKIIVPCAQEGERRIDEVGRYGTL